MKIKCFLLEDTGKMTPFIEGMSQPIYRRADTGEELLLKDVPAGAIWEASWLAGLPEYCGPDGKAYVCRTPGGDWYIDSEASNCTRKGDLSHKCWCRHGVAPNFTVNKEGNTCSAGAGSIQCGNYHGFLINGELVDSR